MNFNDIQSFSVLDWTIIALSTILIVVFFIQIFYYLWYYMGVYRLNKKIKKGIVSYQDKLPPVSVVICARNEADNLRKNLDSILRQDYPDFEVIVVNDGSLDETNDVLTYYKDRYSNLYTTFLHEDAKFISRKKMALTVGIKAAKNEILLLTDADCMPSSPNWIRTIVRNFDDQTELVLGYGAYYQEGGLLKQMISYDTFSIALQYMGFALRGNPYMGVGRNLAYRKSMFERNNGFMTIMNIQSGDDDLFVSQVANSHNTKIEIAQDSITTSEPKTTFHDWYVQKWRHLLTSPRYKKTDKARIGTEVFSRFLFYATCLVLAIIAPLYIKLAVAGIFIARFLMQLIVLNLSANVLGERKFHVNIIAFDIFLPLVNLHILTFGKPHRNKNNSVRWK